MLCIYNNVIHEMGATDDGESSNIGIPHQTTSKGPVSKIPNLQKKIKEKIHCILLVLKQYKKSLNSMSFSNQSKHTTIQTF